MIYLFYYTARAYLCAPRTLLTGMSDFVPVAPVAILVLGRDTLPQVSCERLRRVRSRRATICALKLLFHISRVS